MTDNIILTWHGHSCFTVTYADYSIVFDPYEDYYIRNLPPLKLQAHQVLCSHQHSDHNFVQAVQILPPASCPFNIEKITCAHDEVGGAKRGSNTIHLLTDETYRIAHFGDIGCQLTEEQIKKLQNLDIALLPIGGIYTVDAFGAQQICQAIRPKTVIPMHYRNATTGLPELDTVDNFARLRNNAVYLTDNMFCYNKASSSQTVILKYPI